MSELTYSFYVSRLLVLTPSKRLTAKAALNHPWMTPDAETIDYKFHTDQYKLCAALYIKGQLNF